MYPFGSHFRLLALGMLVYVLIWSNSQAEARGSPRLSKAQTFLQSQLPLRLVVTTPTGLAGNEATTAVAGRQALTAVFSRPVIALGSDFGQPKAQQKFPFSLSCGVPGKFRWVTTTIARFDPDVDWPTDLDCELSWATNLTSYDGAPLVLDDTAPKHRLSTSPLSVWVTDVTSAAATNLTEGMWSAAVDGQFEVPPDGKIMLSFSHPVNLALLQSALKVVEASQPSGQGVAFDVGPCQSAAPWMYFLTGHGSASSSYSSSPSSSGSSLSLDVNTTCAEVTPKSQLKPGAAYLLSMTRGSRYHALAGPLQRDLDATVHGLRPFRLPFTDSYSNSADYGTRYRRLDLWLPHGLSPDTPPEALAARISLCQVGRPNGCTATPFTFSLVTRGRARLNVSSLQPRTQYKISVTADPRVKDGFGQGLQASELTFWSGTVSYAFMAPQLDAGVAVLEAGGVEALEAWPFVTRAPGPAAYYGEVTSSIRAWDLNLADDRIQGLVTRALPQYGYSSGNDLAAWFGNPSVTLAVPSDLLSTASSNALDWTELRLPLRDEAAPSRARLVSYTSLRGYNQYTKLILNSSLSFHVVQSGPRLTAWVLDASAGGSPVAGAAVTVFERPSDYWNQPEPRLLAKCVTDSDGLCSMTHQANDGWVLTAFAVAGGQFAVLEGAGFARGPTQPPSFVGSLVADRLVVVPGDSIKVTGFVQRVTPDGLQLPQTTYGALRLSPNWQASAGASAGVSGSVGGAVSGSAGGAVKTGGRRRQLQQSENGVAKTSAAAVTEGSVLPMTGTDFAAVVYSADVAVGRAVSGGVFTEPAALAAPAAFAVKVNGTTGTFHAEISVPKDVRLQSYTLVLAVPPAGTPEADPSLPEPAPGSPQLLSWAAVPAAHLTFTVADPRPPTADLKLVSPPWVLPTSALSFNVTAVSYIGASVSGASLTATWHTAKATGLMQLTTDGAGQATGRIDLGALPPANVSDPYDMLYITVEWIGPTRERITRSATVTLADGPARLQLQLSLTPSTPLTAFAVAATLTSNTDGAPLPGVPLTATLRPDPNDSAPPCTTGANSPSSTSSCSTTSGAPFSPSCQLALPCVGRFLLEACAEVPTSAAEGMATQRVCVRQTLGRNASEWAARPLQSHPEPLLFTDKTSYSLGDVVRLQLQNPWPGARLLLHWGNEFRSRSRVVPAFAAGLVELSLGPLGEEALGGASLVAVLEVPRLPPAGREGDAAALVPTSPLFDPRAPHSHVLRAVLDVRPDNSLAVSVGVAADAGGGWTIRDVEGVEVVAVEPGAQAEISVTVRSGLGADAPAPTAGSVEVTVYGVDKAFLDLMPYGLPHPEQEMVLRLAADVNAHGISAYRLASGAVRAVYDKLMARLTGLDPWLPLDTAVRPHQYADSAVDTNDTTYLSAYSTALTSMPNNVWYGSGFYPERLPTMVATADMAGQMLAAAAGPKGVTSGAIESASGSGGAAPSAARNDGGSAGSGVSVRYQSGFVVTPLFATAATDADGTARVTFTAPQNLGTFVLRAFAASGSSGGRYGSGEARLAVRRRLSLTPSLPRFVRVGDSFSAGVLVTVGSAPAAVTVTIQLDSASASAAPLSLTGAASQTVTFAAGGGLQHEVRFPLSAGAIGSANLTFTARDSQPGGGADALQTQLRVMGQQGDVWVATSFTLAASPPPKAGSGVVQWQEGMDLPAAVPGSGGLNLTAGVGYFPAIAGMYDTLLQTEADRSYASAVPAVMWATLPAVLSYYDQPLREAQSAAVASAFKDLTKLTRSDVGLMWSDPARWNSWNPTRTDLYLNTWALFLATLHGPALRPSASASASSSAPAQQQLPPSLVPMAASWASLESDQMPMWRGAVARQLVADAIESRQRSYNPGPYSDWDTLAWARLALGGGWVPSDASDQIRDDLSLAALVRNNRSMSRQARVLTSLVLQAMGPSANPSPKLVAVTVQEVTSALRVQGRTAYVAAGTGVSAASSLEDQALSLLLLLRAGVTHQLLPKLAAYLANPARSSGAGFGALYVASAPRDQALAVAALSEYDRARGSSKPNLELSADVNGLTVLKASFKVGGSTRPVSNTTAWEDVPAPPTNEVSALNFEVTGSGEVTVAASLHFVPAQLLSFPTYRGLFVEAALQMADPLTGGPTGQRLAAVPLGSMVALTVQLTSPDDLGPVTLSILMPAGLEPIDPNLEAAGTGASPGGLGLSCGANWIDSWSSLFRWWWWPVCPSQETRPYLVTFSYLALRAGTSSVTIKAVAATPGSFVFPPIRASADNQPELLGMTAATNLTVCADCAKPTYAGALPLPIACQNDCSGRGMCNLRTGKCRCDPGFGRADCSRPVA